MLTNEIDDLDKQRKTEEEYFGKIAKEVESLEQKEEELSSEEKQKIELYEKLKDDNQNAESIKDELLRRQKDLSERVSLLQSTYVETKKQKKQREIIKDMQENVTSGLYGYVTDLCKPISRRFNLAICAALGKVNEELVTDTFQSALRCIEYLRSHRLCRMEMCSLDRVPSSADSSRLRKLLPNDVKLAIDCITFDDKFERLFQHVLQDMVIVESFEEGRRLSQEFFRKHKIKLKVTTLRGEKILKNANIIVDSEQQAGGTRFDERELRSLQKELDEVNEKLGDIRDSEHNSSSRLESLCSEKHRIRREIEKVKSRKDFYLNNLEKNEERIFKCENCLDEKRREKEQTQNKLDTLQKKLEEEEKSVEAAEKRIFKKLSEELGVEDIKKLENDLKKAKNERFNKIASHQNRKNKLTGDLEETRQKLEELKDSKKFEEEKSKILSKISEAKNKMNKIEQQITNCEEKMAEARKVQTENANEKKNIDLELQKLKEDMQNLREECERYTDKIAAQDDKIKAAEENAQELLKQAHLDGVKIPQKDGQLSDARALANSRLPLRDMQICYDSLPRQKKDMISSSERSAVELHMEEKIGEMRGNLDTKTPNLKAEEQFDEVNKNIQTLDQEIYSVRKTCTEAEKRFKSVRKTRATKFLNCFNFVRNAINRIYHNLTKEYEDGVGGQAFLDLDDMGEGDRDEEPYKCGVRFHAMPPSKRFRDMQQLSGGEKTMAALALLFALQSFHPSPFFVLDEVDAALDPKNVKALAHYLQKTSFQSIIISLKDKLYSQVETLIGVLKDVENETSMVVSIDLTLYKNKDKDEEEGGKLTKSSSYSKRHSSRQHLYKIARERRDNNAMLASSGGDGREESILGSFGGDDGGENEASSIFRGSRRSTMLSIGPNSSRSSLCPPKPPNLPPSFYDDDYEDGGEILHAEGGEGKRAEIQE